jgi:hypothetical protein
MGYVDRGDGMEVTYSVKYEQVRELKKLFLSVVGHNDSLQLPFPNFV